MSKLERELIDLIEESFSAFGVVNSGELADMAMDAIRDKLVGALSLSEGET